MAWATVFNPLHGQNLSLRHSVQNGLPIFLSDAYHTLRAKVYIFQEWALRLCFLFNSTASPRAAKLKPEVHSLKNAWGFHLHTDYTYSLWVPKYQCKVKM